MGYAMDEWIVAWNPASADSADHTPALPGVGQVEVGLNDPGGWAVLYDFSSGSCYPDRRKMTAEGKALMMIDFHKVVVRDGIDPQAAHQQFLEIDEYRRFVDDD
jgi:hypothetical protein